VPVSIALAQRPAIQKLIQTLNQWESDREYVSQQSRQRLEMIKSGFPQKLRQLGMLKQGLEPPPRMPFSRTFVVYCVRAALLVSGMTGLVLLWLAIGQLLRCADWIIATHTSCLWHGHILPLTTGSGLPQ
jgi:hypothetical protein